MSGERPGMSSPAPAGTVTRDRAEGSRTASRSAVTEVDTALRARAPTPTITADAATRAVMTKNARRSTAAEPPRRSEEHTSELQSLMRTSYAVFCLKKTTHNNTNQHHTLYMYNNT